MIKEKKKRKGEFFKELKRIKKGRTVALKQKKKRGEKKEYIINNHKK